MSLSRIPAELTDTIITLAVPRATFASLRTEDKAALRAFSLVARSWRTRSQALLYEHVDLNHWHLVEACYALLTHAPRFARVIRSIRVGFYFRDDDEQTRARRLAALVTDVLTSVEEFHCMDVSLAARGVRAQCVVDVIARRSLRALRFSYVLLGERELVEIMAPRRHLRVLSFYRTSLSYRPSAVSDTPVEMQLTVDRLELLGANPWSIVRFTTDALGGSLKQLCLEEPNGSPTEPWLDLTRCSSLRYVELPEMCTGLLVSKLPANVKTMVFGAVVYTMSVSGAFLCREEEESVGDVDHSESVTAIMTRKGV